jgi:hypothetical protein
MAVRLIPRVCAAIFVSGIAGLIVVSLNGNNGGWLLTVGLVIAFAVVALLTYSSVAGKGRIDEFVDADLELLEPRIRSLVDSGADEGEVRDLVREALHRRRR